MKTKQPDAIDVEVGHRIRIHRMARGISQSHLGEKLGVTFQQVQKYEKGVNRIGAGRLTRIAKILNVPVTVLFGVDTESSKGQTPPSDSNVLAQLSLAGAVQLVQAYAQIPTSALRRTVVDLVEQIGNSKTK